MTEVVDLLRQILDELRARPVNPASTCGLRDNERASLTRFVSSIAAAIGDRMFTARELAAHADSVDPILKAALERAGCDGDSRRLGKRLQRAEGRPLQGYKVERIGSDRDGAIWRIDTHQRLSLPRDSRSNV